MFCESLARDINPYLPELMNRLFAALNPQNSVKLRELGLSAVAATGESSKTRVSQGRLTDVDDDMIINGY